MPWRKYTPSKGKYGDSYKIARGVQVRKDSRGKWTLFIEKQGKRKNHTFEEPGRQGLSLAIKAGELVAAELVRLPKTASVENEPASEIPTFEAFSRNWLEANRRRWEQETFARYECVLRLHIWPHESVRKCLDQVTRQDIKDLLRGVFNKRSAATVETVHGVISGIFNEAFDEGHVQGNPSAMLLKNILPPKNRRDDKEPNPLNKEELEFFLQHAQNLCCAKEAMLLKVMAYTGMRLGEALAMQARDLAVDKATYHITQQYKLHSYRKPKHGKQRLIDLPRSLMLELCGYIALLRKESLKAGSGGRAGRLFLDPQEGLLWPYSQRRVQGLIERVCKKAGLSRRNPHDLRHTYATILLMAHRSPAYVQKQLGHHSISMTVDIYGHWIPGEGREGLDEAFGTGALVRNAVQKSHIIAYQKKRSR